MNRRLVLLERIGLVARINHRFARQEQATTDELRVEQLWSPLTGAPEDWVQYLHELAARFGLDIDYSGSTVGLANFLRLAA